uniref:Peptidoglycan recognition protein 6 n=1 Tax=Scleropages formosus TaxID=113540 RepID=A0A8C9RAU0_SCLFO
EHEASVSLASVFRLTAAFPRHMSYFIGAVEHIEARNPNLKPLDVVKGLREISGLDDMFTQHYLGRISDRRSGAALLLDSEVSQFLGDVIQHRVTDRGEEEGVVLPLSSLTLPLSYMYIHHTYEPGEPCVSFEQCAAAMRSMQRYHQESNGWDDIGYSFVAGSDGYIYEGRGWYWQGAHTGGYNSKGYGVAIIGDFTVRLPSQHTLNLVKDELPACAVSGGRLVPTYIVHGHRQMVATECPGNALYEEIGTWPHFCVSANDSICAIYATLHF